MMPNCIRAMHWICPGFYVIGFGNWTYAIDNAMAYVYW